MTWLFKKITLWMNRYNLAKLRTKFLNERPLELDVNSGAKLTLKDKENIDAIFNQAMLHVDDGTYEEELANVKQVDVLRFVAHQYPNKDVYIDETLMALREIEEYIKNNHGSFLNWALLPQYDMEMDTTNIVLVFIGYELQLEKYREARQAMMPSIIESMTKYYDMSQMSRYYYEEKRDVLVEKSAMLAALLSRRRFIDALELKSRMVKERLDYIGYDMEEE